MINYDKLLDDWADYLLAKAQKADEDRSFEQVGSNRDGYLRGYSDGIREASAYLTLLEKRKRHLYEDNEI